MKRIHFLQNDPPLMRLGIVLWLVLMGCVLAIVAVGLLRGELAARPFTNAMMPYCIVLLLATLACSVIGFYLDTRT